MGTLSDSFSWKAFIVLHSVAHTKSLLLIFSPMHTWPILKCAWMSDWWLLESYRNCETQRTPPSPNCDAAEVQTLTGTLSGARTFKHSWFSSFDGFIENEENTAKSFCLQVCLTFLYFPYCFHICSPAAHNEISISWNWADHPSSLLSLIMFGQRQPCVTVWLYSCITANQMSATTGFHSSGGAQHPKD